MHARELLDRGARRLGAGEAGERLVVERGQHGAQPVGPFRMVRPGSWPRQAGWVSRSVVIMPPRDAACAQRPSGRCHQDRSDQGEEADGE